MAREEHRDRKLPSGFYEQVVNTAIAKALQRLEGAAVFQRAIEPEDSARLFTAYVADYLEKTLSDLPVKNRLGQQVNLVNRLLSLLAEAEGAAGDEGQHLLREARLLQAILEETPSSTKKGPSMRELRPITSLAESSLFTGARDEPSLESELKKEIRTASRVDFLVSFIKWSGLRLLLDELAAFTEKGGRLRVLTTTYMGATDSRAVAELARLPNTKVRISYDTKRTRLHAKAYIFERDTGFSTAYIGSSNLTNVALSSGLEWNLKIAARDQKITFDKLLNTFSSYWSSSEFEDYEEGQFERLKKAIRREREPRVRGGSLALFSIQPYPYQQEILDRLAAERQIHGRKRNLVVVSTGERIIITTGCIKVLISRVSGTFIKTNHALLRVIRYNCCKQCMKDQNLGYLTIPNYLICL